jgi:hypothetical protein
MQLRVRRGQCGWLPSSSVPAMMLTLSAPPTPTPSPPPSWMSPALDRKPPSTQAAQVRPSQTIPGLPVPQ